MSKSISQIKIPAKSLLWFVIITLTVLLQACIMPKEFDMPISVICNCVPQSLMIPEDKIPVKEDLELLSNKKKQQFLDCLARADFQQKTAFEVDNPKDRMPKTPRKLFYEKVTKNCPDALELLKLIH